MTSRPPAPPRQALLAIVISALIGCLATRADDAAQPPRAHLESVARIAAATDSARSLGVTLSRASHVLRRQLGLRRGAGLVVDEVAPGSAAARAGFVQHDVLVRLDDQWLLLPEQFDALLEAAEPEDPLDCTVLRGGREVVIGLGAAPGGQRPRAATRPLRPTASSLALVPRQSPASLPRSLEGLSDETLVRQDGDFSIVLSRGDRTRVVVSDAAGVVVFAGELDGAGDRDRLPEAVRQRVAEMERQLEPRTADAATAVVPAAGTKPAAEIGRLEVSPIELR